MNAILAATRAWTRARPIPWGRLRNALLVIGAGVLLGVQYMHPDKRMIAVLVAAIVAGIAWRLDTLSGIGLLVITLPYPRGTVFGNTNLALILLLLIIWLLRITQRHGPGPRATPVDAPVSGLLMAYALSFYNIADRESLGFAFQNTYLLVASVLMFYMIVGNVRTDEDLQRVHTFQAISFASIFLLAIYELNHPGGALVPGWIEFKGTTGTEFNTRNVRVGGPFFDFELLSEFSALSMLVVVFMIARARSYNRRLALFALLTLNVFIQFATVTRGGMIALLAGLGYLLFVIRRRVQVVPLTLMAGAVVATVWLMNSFVANFTRSGDLLARLKGTQFHGLVPDSRSQAWSDGWQRFLEHPLIGHGPYYSPITGTKTWFWPHNGYLLIADLVGLVGLTFYLWLFFALFRISRPPVDDLHDPSYARAFLIIGHVQLFVFMIDQVKIDYLRNPIYQFEVWLMFAVITAAYMVARNSPARAAPNPT